MHFFLLMLCFPFFYNVGFAVEGMAPGDPYIKETVDFSPKIISSPSLVNMSSLPSCIVDNAVNVISGDFFDYTIHHETTGPTPYQLGSIYTSSNVQKNSLGIAWGYTHNYLIETRQEFGIEYTKGGFFHVIGSAFKKVVVNPIEKVQSLIGKVQRAARGTYRFLLHPSHYLASSPSDLKTPKSDIVLRLHEAGGGVLQFTGDSNGKKMKIEIADTGYTNISGNMSGKNNIKNIKAYYVKHAKEWHVSYPDGSFRVYVKAKEPHNKSLLDSISMRKEAFYRRDFVLHREKTPSGNNIYYEYDGTRIKKIYTKSRDNKHTINWVTFSYPQAKKEKDGYFQKVTTSDGYTAIFYHKKITHPSLKEPGYLVRKITSPIKPPTCFSYTKDHKLEKHLVTKKTEADGNYLAIGYHSSSQSFKELDYTTNTLEDFPWDGLTREDRDLFEKRFLKQRVASLYRPLGKNGEKIKLYSFSYNKRRLTNAKLIYRCIVKDALENSTYYYFNHYQRLTRIEYRTKENKILSIQKYVWANAPGNHEGRLVAQIVLNEKNSPLFAKRYHYDRNGNITQEDLYGDITGEKNSFSLDRKGLPCNSKEVARTKYTYSKDGMNLVTSTIDPLGNHTYYQYKPKTDLITGIIRCDGTIPKERQFFSYDSCGLVIEKIIDDGRTKDKNNLSGVTQKTSTEYTYRYASPHFGQIAIVREFYFDIEKKEKLPLNKTVHTFNSKGTIIKKELYDSERTLKATVEFEYDALGRVISTKDAEGNQIFTKYDKNGRIQEKKGPRKDVLLEYSYDHVGRLQKKTLLQENEKPLTSFIVYDPLGRIIEAVDPQENKTKYTYDALGRTTSITYPQIFSESGKAIVPIKKYLYENCGLKVTQIDENGRSTTTSYTVLGKPSLEISQDKTRKELRYDLMGNMIEEYNSLGVTTTYTYDFSARVTSVKTATRDNEVSTKTSVYTGPHLTEESYSTGKCISHRYDPAGKKIRSYLYDTSNKAHERLSKFTYDTLGRILEEHHHTSVESFVGIRYTYDKLSRITKKETIDNTGTLFSWLRYAYDEDGNRIKFSRPIMEKTASTKITYYPTGEIKSVKDAEDRRTEIHIDRFYKNQYGQTVTKKITLHPDSMIEEEIFDTHARLVKKIIKTPSDAIQSQKELFYDAVGNIIAIKTAILNTLNPLQNIIVRTKYGPCNRREAVREEFLEHTTTSTTKYLYNEYGQLNKIERPESTVQYTYDAKGRPNRIFGTDFDYTYAYDSEDHIVESRNMSKDKETRKKYNSLGDLIEETLENGTKISYAYDGLGRVISVGCKKKSIFYAYSPFALTEICYTGKDTEPAYYTVLDRDLSGNILKDSRGIEYSYDPLGRASSITHDLFKEKATQYDTFGRVTQKEIQDASDKYTLLYLYDHLGQLQEEHGHFSLQYFFNSVGQREAVNEVPYKHTKKHAIKKVGSTIFNYSKDGCRTAMQKENKETKYRYDGLDRLIEVASEGKKIFYSYDGFDRMISKTTIQGDDVSSEDFIYFHENEVGSISDDQIQEFRVLKNPIDSSQGNTIFIELQGKLFTAVQDLAENTVLLFDSSNNPQELYRFSAFGKESTTGTKNNPWRFSSKRKDPDTNFILFGKRFYDPKVGQWTTKDLEKSIHETYPYGFFDNNPSCNSKNTESILPKSIDPTHRDPENSPLFYEYEKRSPFGLQNDKFHIGNKEAPHRSSWNKDFSKYDGSSPYNHSKEYTFEPGKFNLGVEPKIGSVPGIDVPGEKHLFVNGMRTSETECIAEAQYLQSLYGGRTIDYVYCPSLGIIGSVCQAILGFFGVENSYEQACKNRIEKTVNELPPDGMLHMTGHSQGAIHIGNALGKLPFSTRQHCTVVTVAPGAQVTPDRAKFVKNIFNDKFVRDFVPLFDILGRMRSRKNTERVPSHKDAPPLDHSLTSPTYKEAIQNAYQERLQEGTSLCPR